MLLDVAPPVVPIVAVSRWVAAHEVAPPPLNVGPATVEVALGA